MYRACHSGTATCTGGADYTVTADPAAPTTGATYNAANCTGTVSIAANGINGQDGMFLDGGAFARSRLVRHHLAQWAEWSSHGGDPWGGRFRGRVDLGKVVLVGHSRGGEGVERAAIDTWPEDPWRVQGLVLIGPTAFGRQVAAGIHTAVILPFCDGDVSDLQGQQYVDVGRDLTHDRALRASVMAMGTNHNYYNTEWTPGLSKSPAWDDWFDPGDAQCGETRGRRLSPVEQQAVGLAYTAALVDLAVGGDARSLSLLDGTRAKPRSIGRANAFVHAIGGNKRLVYAAGRGDAVQTNGLEAAACRGYYSAGPFDLRPGCTPDHYFELTPHWSPMAFAETAPAPRALKVEWERAGGWLRIPIEPGAGGADVLDFRVAGDPGAPPVELGLRVRTVDGRWVALDTGPLVVRSYHGPSPLGKVVARQLRASLRSAGIALRDVTAVELRPLAPRGRFWLLDISAREPRLAASDAIHLPRVSVGDLVVPEGDAGDVTVDVPIIIDGPVRQRARLWVQFTDYADFEQPTRGVPLVLEPGASTASVPFTFAADDVYNPYARIVQVTLLARRNAVTGDYDGSVRVADDEPPPSLTVDAARVTAAEGGTLAWTFRLSAPLADSAFWSIQIMPSDGRFAALDSDDVPAWYLEQFGIVPPVPAVPLSELGLFLGIEFAPGATEATVAIPVAADALTEPTEGVVLLLDGFGDPVVPAPIELTGEVP